MTLAALFLVFLAPSGCKKDCEQAMLLVRLTRVPLDATELRVRVTVQGDPEPKTMTYDQREKWADSGATSFRVLLGPRDGDITVNVAVEAHGGSRVWQAEETPNVSGCEQALDLELELAETKPPDAAVDGPRPPDMAPIDGPPPPDLPVQGPGSKCSDSNYEFEVVTGTLAAGQTIETGVISRAGKNLGYEWMLLGIQPSNGPAEWSGGMVGWPQGTCPEDAHACWTFNAVVPQGKAPFAFRLLLGATDNDPDAATAVQVATCTPWP